MTEPNPRPLSLGRFELCLTVRDLAASISFYEKLGFAQTGGIVDQGWAILVHDAVTLGLYQGMIETNVLNFRGEDVFEVARRLRGRGLTFRKDAHVESDGSVGAVIEDPDGNVIYFNTAEGETTEREGRDDVVGGG